MQAWQNLSIATKVVMAFALVFVATLGLGLFGLSQTAAVNDKAANVRDNWLPSTAALGKLVSAVRESRVREARAAISAGANSNADLTDDSNAIQAAQADAERAYADYQPLITAGTDDERLMRTYADAWVKLKASNARVLDLAKRHDLKALDRLFDTEDRAAYNAAVNAIVADMDFNAAQGKIAAQAGEATYRSARLMTIAVLVLCGLLCIGAGLAIVRGISPAAAPHLDRRGPACRGRSGGRRHRSRTRRRDRHAGARV